MNVRLEVRLEVRVEVRVEGGVRASWGRVGADQDSTVPSPNDPMVANRVAGGQLIRWSLGKRRNFES